MSNFELSMKFEVKPEIMFQNIIDFEYYPNFMKQIKDVKIIKKEGNEVVTEETLMFKTLFKKEIIQQTTHRIEKNKIYSVINSGIAKGSIVDIVLEECEKDVNVIVKIELKLELRGKIFEPLIKRYMKMYVIGLLRKINTKIWEKN